MLTRLTHSNICQCNKRRILYNLLLLKSFCDKVLQISNNVNLCNNEYCLFYYMFGLNNIIFINHYNYF